LPLTRHSLPLTRHSLPLTRHSLPLTRHSLPLTHGRAARYGWQARNVDSTVWFELYHASRESFTYIKEFYVGEICAEDLHAVPRATDALGSGNAAGTASSEFSCV